MGAGLVRPATAGQGAQRGQGQGREMGVQWKGRERKSGTVGVTRQKSRGRRLGEQMFKIKYRQMSK